MDSVLFILKSFALGIVEGITEFLPVSSTGHLIIFENLLNFQAKTPNYVETYTYVIQLGAILAVVVLYWGKIKQTLMHLFPDKKGNEKSGFYFWLMIFIACIPGGIFGILFDDLAQQYLFTPVSVAVTLFLGGLIMIAAEKKFRATHKKASKDWSVTPKQAFIIGLFQCLAIIPGMSRSASTIIGGWISGLDTIAATEFSFFLAIPVMIGMSFLKLVKIGGFMNLAFIELISLAVGFAAAFIVALLVVKKFIAYLKKKPMRIFAVYRIIFAVIVLISGFAGIF